MQSNEEGFTLVELIVVMVIIGILAASALPRLQGLQGTAKTTKLSEFKSGLEASIQGVRGKAQILGETGAVTFNGTSIAVADSYYPEQAKSLIDTDDVAFNYSSNGKFQFQGTQDCALSYNQGNGSINISIISGGCN